MMMMSAQLEFYSASNAVTNWYDLHRLENITCSLVVVDKSNTKFPLMSVRMSASYLERIMFFCIKDKLHHILVRTFCIACSLMARCKRTILRPYPLYRYLLKLTASNISPRLVFYYSQ